MRKEADKSLTLETVEEACELGKTSLQRYQSGRSAMKTGEARRVFEYYGVDPEQIEMLLEHVERSRKRTRPINEIVPAWFQTFLLLEREAEEIAELALTMIPGLLQTEDYARTVLEKGLVGSIVDDYVESRMERKKVLEGPNPLRFWAVIHEGALWRMVGNKDTMRAQLFHLVEMAQRPNVTIVVIPNRLGAHVSMDTSFHWIRFDTLLDPLGIIYTESLTGARYLDDPDEVTQHERAFRHLTNAALSEIDSVRLIKDVNRNYCE
ncbi:DUF5753 domain-containing protein [Natronoglycomyces albus]|uniref:DUF5753 domain-containing protein n=1 Tax=Natronoglycomyces albus TaxID=2811108 RepID=A0A895XV83_9ACTN|nr:DUF5753 domain-containing protein [Natronoglycomyces albus]QSB07169.1 hypothetical protein JQS30_17150 [Natronoglycomyces albus]